MPEDWDGSRPRTLQKAGQDKPPQNEAKANGYLQSDSRPGKLRSTRIDKERPDQSAQEQQQERGQKQAQPPAGLQSVVPAVSSGGWFIQAHSAGDYAETWHGDSNFTL